MTVFLLKKCPHFARLFTKFSSSEKLVTLQKVAYRVGKNGKHKDENKVLNYDGRVGFYSFNIYLFEQGLT